MALISETLTRAVEQHRAGDYAGAEGMYREVLRSQPNHAEALHWLGVLARQTGRAELAIESIAKAVELNARDPAFFFHLANVLRDQRQFDQAATHYRRAIEVDPTFARAHLNLGTLLYHQGLLHEALGSFERGLALQPHDAPSRWLRGLILLQTGDLAAGWPEYEWRRRPDAGALSPRLAAPCWSGESLDRKTLLVEPEASLEDQIMFASCLPELISLARKVIVGCEARLVTTFARSFPRALVCSQQVLLRPDGLPCPELRVPFGSLPRYLRGSLERFPRHSGFLIADPQLRQRWWRRFSELGDGLKVGISWRGGRTAASNERSTTLDQWLRVLRVPEVSFINLQLGECTEELNAARDRHGVTISDWNDEPGAADLDQRLAKIAALDLVITVPNVTAHLAGGLGVEVWNLLTHVPSWRWMLDREDSPWYPSMRLFRQSRAGAWEGLFEQIAKELSRRPR